MYDTWHMEDRGLSSRAGETNVCISVSFIATFQLDVLLQVAFACSGPEMGSILVYAER